MYWQGKKEENTYRSNGDKKFFKKINEAVFSRRLPVADFDRLIVANGSLFAKLPASVTFFAKLPASVTFFRQIASIQIGQFDSSKKN